MTQIIIGLFLFLVTFVLLQRDIEAHRLNFIRFFTFFTAFLFLFSGFVKIGGKTAEQNYNEGYKDGQTDMLIGIQKYELNFKYEKINGEFIPTDTLFIKIDESFCH